MDIREILKCDPDAFMERMLRDRPQTVIFDRQDVAKALIAYGDQLSQAGDYCQAEQYYREAYDINQDSLVEPTLSWLGEKCIESQATDTPNPTETSTPTPTGGGGVSTPEPGAAPTPTETPTPTPEGDRR